MDIFNKNAIFTFIYIYDVCYNMKEQLYKNYKIQTTIKDIALSMIENWYELNNGMYVSEFYKLYIAGKLKGKLTNQ